MDDNGRPLSEELREEWIRDALHTRKLAIKAVVAWAVVATIGMIGIGINASGIASATHTGQVNSNSIASILRMDQTTLNRSQMALAQSVQANQLAQAINQDRRLTCLAQNARNTSTLNELDHLLARDKRHATRAERKTLTASRRFTALLINHLVPLENCNAIPLYEP